MIIKFSRQAARNSFSPFLNLTEQILKKFPVNPIPPLGRQPADGYNLNMQEHHFFPDANRLSVLAAIILFVLALTPFITLPPQAIQFSVFNIQFNLNFNIHTLVSLLVAAMAAVGSEWLVRSHPNLQDQTTFQHWLLPAFSAWVIDVPLSTIAVGPQWWIIFGFGGVFLVLIFVAEFISVDLSDSYHVPASAALSAVAFALFLVLAITVRGANLRLYVLIPALVISTFLVCIRTLYLRLSGKWAVGWGLAITLFIAQIAIGMHYLRLFPAAFGIILLGCLYALTSAAVAVEEDRPIRTAWIEPVTMLVIFLGLAALFQFS